MGGGERLTGEGREAKFVRTAEPDPVVTGLAEVPQGQVARPRRLIIHGAAASPRDRLIDISHIDISHIEIPLDEKDGFWKFLRRLIQGKKDEDEPVEGEVVDDKKG